MQKKKTPSRSAATLKVINLFGAPGVGKSSIAAGLYSKMKESHYSVELCREYAKYLTITDRNWQLEEEQLYLFAKQHHELFILRGKYKFAITDSPLLLTSFYANPLTTPNSFHQCVTDYNNTFDNINVLVTRDLSAASSVFENEGRIHDRAGSIKIQKEQPQFLEKNKVNYIHLELLEGRNNSLYLFELLNEKGLLE